MLRGLYSSASALDASMQRQEITAENLAHLSTPGYRTKGMVFESFSNVLGQSGLAPENNSMGVKPAGVYSDFQTGALRQTGNPLHLALDGDPFFVVEGPRGPVFTRNGSFHLGAGGQLLSDGNYPVLGSNGPIIIPGDANEIIIAHDGNVTADGNPIGQLRLARFGRTDKLTSAGPTLYEATPEAAEQPADGGVRQGYLESSNVAPAIVMVEMIQTARYFEMAQRALRSVAETIQLNTRPGN